MEQEYKKRPDQEFYEKHKDDIDFGEKNLRADKYHSAKPYSDFRHLVQEHSPIRLKDTLFRHPGQQIKNLSNKGYGVITTMPIKKGEIIEECVVPYETIEPGWEYLDGVMYARNQNVLVSYRFAGPENNNENTKGKSSNCWVMPLGNAAIYNHSKDPNMFWYHEPAQRLIVFQARRDIAAGEELCHCYTYFQSEPGEFDELKKKKHYHPQFMRQPLDFEPKTAPNAPVLENPPVDIVNDNTPDQVISPIEVDPDWEPPTKGEKKSDPKSFLDKAKGIEFKDKKILKGNKEN
jgi:hypothetical protein